MRHFAVILLFCLVAPEVASARKAEDTYFNSVIPMRVDHLVGFIPTTFVMYPPGKPVRPITVRVGSVRALSHPDAYPIAFVTLRRLRDATPIAAAFLKYLTGPRATSLFRRRGMLPATGAWPDVSVPEPEPEPEPPPAPDPEPTPEAGLLGP